MSRVLIVTHHAPDLDACTSTWLLKRFDSQHYADAKLAFVNPGEEITLEEAELQGCQLHEVTHVDTGFGKFDHHQPERGHEYISATSLVYDHLLKIHPEYVDDKPLKTLVDFVTEIDHFGEVEWPEPDNVRYCFMLNEVIRGMEFTNPRNDESQIFFAFQCLENVYATLTQFLKAEEILDEEGIEIELKTGQALALETRNDDTIKLAQKRGYDLVIKKNPEQGNIRIKARPDSNINLKQLAVEIAKLDTKGTWFFHPSGKMLINGSGKHRDQIPSPLSLDQVIALVRDIYA